MSGDSQGRPSGQRLAPTPREPCFAFFSLGHPCPPGSCPFTPAPWPLPAARCRECPSCVVRVRRLLVAPAACCPLPAARVLSVVPASPVLGPAKLESRARTSDNDRRQKERGTVPCTRCTERARLSLLYPASCLVNSSSRRLSPSSFPSQPPPTPPLVLQPTGGRGLHPVTRIHTVTSPSFTSGATSPLSSAAAIFFKPSSPRPSLFQDERGQTEVRVRENHTVAHFIAAVTNINTLPQTTTRRTPSHTQSRCNRRLASTSSLRPPPSLSFSLSLSLSLSPSLPRPKHRSAAYRFT